MFEQFFNSQEVYFQLARFVVTITIGVFLTRMVLMPLTRKAMSTKGSDMKARHSVQNIVAIVGLFISFVVALQAGNFGGLVTVLGTVAAALTVAVGFGMRDQVSSVVSGIFIHTDNPFVTGDYIKVNEFEGVVKDIKLRATVLNGRNHGKQIIPNNIITGNVVKNLTKGHRTKTMLEVNLASENLDKASKILSEVAKQHEKVLEKPEPQIDYVGVDQGKIITQLSYWLKDSSQVSSVRTEILREFNQKAVGEGIFTENKD